MKKALLIVLLLIGMQSLAQKHIFTKNLNTKKNYYTEIGFEFVSEKIIIPVKIEGKTYRFIFDTGAPNLISAHLKNAIKTASIKSMNIRDASNKRQSLDLVSVPEIVLGGVSFKNCPTLVGANKNNFIFDCFEVDGIIGSNMLYRSIVQIDLKNKVIRLTDKKKKLSLNKKEATALYLAGRQKSPYIWIDLMGDKKARERLLIDTGMKGFYAVSKKNFNALQQNNIYTVHHTGYGSKNIGFFGAAEKDEHYRVSVDSLKINHTLFKNVTTETTNDNNSRIGSEILKYGMLTVDYLNRKFYFSPDKSTNNLQEKLLDISATVINNTLVVGIVWDKHLQKEIGFGDEIIKLDTLDVASVPVCDFITLKTSFPKKDMVSLTVKNAKGVIRTLMVKRTFPQ